MQTHEMESDPRHCQLAECLQRYPFEGAKWAGVCFRSVTLKHACPKSLIDGGGTLTGTGRWNPPGVFRGVYLALSPQAAVAEVFQTAGKFGFNRANLRPRVVAAIEVSLRNVADLRKKNEAMGSVCKMSELLSEDWRAANERGKATLSQSFGALMYTAGYEAIMVPSATGEGMGNLLIFNENMSRDSSMEVMNSSELDQWIRLET